MTDPHCYGSIQACAIRVALLDSDGSPTGGNDAGYISDAVIEVGVNVVVTEGEEKELRNGCDAICQTLTNPDRIKRIDLSMTLCQLDVELIQMLTGGTLVTSEGVSIGFELPGPTDDISENGVSFEVYTKAWDGAAQAGNAQVGDPLYWHFVFPRVRWVPGNFNLNGDFLEFPLTGKASTNPNFYDGAFEDLPYAFTKLGGVLLDDTLPTAACGFQNLQAGS